MMYPISDGVFGMTLGDVQPQVLVLDIGEVELPYLQYDGLAESTPIVLLHATGFLPWLWHPIALKLAAAHRVIAPYFCDHRLNEPDKGGVNWMILAQDLKVFCERLGLQAPLMVGHSMGATVITLAAGAFGLKASGMILIEPIFLPEDFYGVQLSVDQHPLASKSIKRRNHWDSGEEALAYLKSRSLFKNWDSEMLDLYVRYGLREVQTGGLNLTCSPEREAALFMGGMLYDPWPILANVPCPVLVVEGGASENRHYIDLKKATTLFPQGSYTLVQGAGHLIPMEQPQTTAALIDGFLERISPAAG
ncbi:MAG: alpha/beta hydrolase [Syntrophaceae bacterium]